METIFTIAKELYHVKFLINMVRKRENYTGKTNEIGD